MKLETERLFLREMTPDDRDALYAALADPDITRHYPYTLDEARVRNWINKNRERYRVFGFGLWAVCLKATGEMIGDCGLTMQNINGAILPEIGYHIAKAGVCKRGGESRSGLGVCKHDLWHGVLLHEKDESSVLRRCPRGRHDPAG